MTAQIAERLHYQGEDVAMCTTPLSEFFSMGGLSPRFRPNATAMLRGYVGRWEIVDGRLYLVEIRGTLMDGTQGSVATIFPDFPGRVFAHWYSGMIRIPQGKQLKCIRQGYRSIFERDLFLDVERGVVKGTVIRTNGTAASENAPEGYQVGAMTAVARGNMGDGTAA